MSDSDELNDIADSGSEDLFGDGDGDNENGNARSPRRNAASDDEDKPHGSSPERRHVTDGYGSDDEPRHQERMISSMAIYRHRGPKTKEGEIQSMKVPNFLKFVPEPYDPKTFEPSEWDIENARSENPKPTIRNLADAETGELKSNAVMYKWSDGSLSMSVGDQHFVIQKKDTVPPPNKPYNDVQDAHSYAAAAHLSSGLFLVVGHISEEYAVSLNKTLQDDALQRLAMRMREAQARDEASRIIKTTHDPELQRKQAEIAEKERMKAQRKRESAAARLDGGPRYGGRGGLSIDDLEGPRRGSGAGKKRGAPGGGKAKRRRPEYDSDDDRPAGARQEDYDLADDFIAPSDEEISEDADDDEEELLDDEEEEDEPRSKRQKTTEADGDEDAEADMDDDVPAHSEHAGRSRRRHVIDDDEED